MWVFRSILLFSILLVCSCSTDRTSLLINNKLSEAPVLHAISKFEELADEGAISLVTNNPDWIINTEIDEALGEEAFRIIAREKEVSLTGGDPVGVMYGLLQILEQLRSGEKEITPIEESPAFSFRAIKFNLPWDSYRNGEALQLHYETCRDTVFWRSFLDMMAENRFNKLTLWNLHPFNYLVKTEKYPEACGFSEEEMAGWEAFWKSLFRMAKNRGIETYLINWNIFVSPEFAKAHHVAEYCIQNQYFVAQGDTSEITKDYTREVIKEVIDKYPDLTGLGITLGEGMGGMTADEREEWLLDSYIEGMRMASRKVKFIHRVPLSAGKGSGGSTDPYVETMTRRTLDTLSCVDGPINIELKFNWSHAHSCPELMKVHGGNLTDAYWNPLPENYYLAWMMRNEDFFILRWGQTDFIREHTARNNAAYVNGYYVGSECYIPAKDYITSLPGTSNRYAFERQWMYYKNWGRLLYNPQTPDDVFSDEFENRFPGNGEQLFDAQQKVSRIPLIIASYWNATWDYTLYSEGFLTMTENNKAGLIPLTGICNKDPMDPDFLSIKEFIAPGKESVAEKITPAELADSIDSFCGQAAKAMEEIQTGSNIDLLYEVSDIKAWAQLGMYFSNKLRSATAYQKYLDSKEVAQLEHSVSWLEKAAAHWHQLVEITEPVYKPMPLQHYEGNNNEYFHWANLESEVLAELDWLKSLLPKN